MIYMFDSGVEPASGYCTNYFSRGDLIDRVGHGTSMASIIKSISKESKIYSVKIGDHKPRLDDIEECLQYVTSLNVDSDDFILFNANLPQSSKLENFNSYIRDLSTKCKIIVPAGNNSSSIDNFSPANNPNVWTIGSLNKSKKITSVSNLNGNKGIDIWVVSTNTPAFTKEMMPIRLFGTSVAAAITAALADQFKIKNKQELIKITEKYNNDAAFH